MEVALLKQLEEALKNVRLMEPTLSNLNASFVVEHLSGFAGDQLIFVKNAILDKIRAIT